MKRISESDIEAIIEAFHAGQVIVFPTETSYGIGCDATNAEAVKRVIDIKKRRADKGLPVLIASLQEAKKHIQFNESASQLAHKYWPGPLNIISTVLPGSPIAEDCHKDGMQALRQSSSPFVQKLFQILELPIVATSANVAGEESCYTADGAWEHFKDADEKPDLIVDGGELPVVPASTMVRVNGDRMDVVRFGGITI